jgi:hypothetical protein
MARTPSRAVNHARQLLAIRAVVPAATGILRRGRLECVLPIQPTPASRRYTVRLSYQHWRRPHVTVIEPPLELHPGTLALPHVHLGDELCLYFPGEWREDMLLATTIIPWTAEWLMHYELWLATGTWSGGGHEPRGTPRPRPRFGTTPSKWASSTQP